MSSTEPEWGPSAVPETEGTPASVAAAGSNDETVPDPPEAQDAPLDEAASGAEDTPEGDPASDSEPLTEAASTEVGEPESTGADTESRTPVVQDGAADQLELTEPAELDRGAIEAILLVTDEPLQASSLAEVLRQPVPRVVAALEELAAEYTEQRRGFELREVAGGWRLYTREEYAATVEKFVLDGQQAKLTQAALETLAVVAYRQPASRARVSAIRGVNCDGVMKTLLARGLVTETGTDQESGATLFGTTGYFLERLGLGSLEELPDLAPYLPDIDEMEELADAMGGRGETSRSEESPAAEQQTDDRERAAGEQEPATGQPAEEPAAEENPGERPGTRDHDQPDGPGQPLTSEVGLPDGPGAEEPDEVPYGHEPEEPDTGEPEELDTGQRSASRELSASETVDRPDQDDQPRDDQPDQDNQPDQDDRSDQDAWGDRHGPADLPSESEVRP